MIAPKRRSIFFIVGAIMVEKYITEEVWIKIFNFLKQYKGIYCGENSKCKRFIEAIFWMARTGAQWRELFETFGKWNSVFSRFNRWSKRGVWQKLLEFCSQDSDLEYVMIDSTIIRAHACAAGYGNQREQGLGRSKGGFTSKIHLKVDALSNPLKTIITSGNTNDITQAEALLEGTFHSYVLADKGYDSRPLRESLIRKNCTPVIPSRSNALNPYKYDKHIYKERHSIECFFSKVKYFRRIFSRFDKSARNFASFIAFVGSLIWLL